LQEYSNELISNKSEIHVEIIDFGIGIPEEDQPKLFNTFYRASNTEGITGTLGLYIVKTFIEKTRIIELESQLEKGLKQHCDYPNYSYSMLYRSNLDNKSKTTPITNIATKFIPTEDSNIAYKKMIEHIKPKKKQDYYQNLADSNQF
jgi:hypothetical protein